MLLKCKLPLAMLMSMVLSILSPQLAATDFGSNNLKINKILTSGLATHSDAVCYPLANCQATMPAIMGLSSLIQPSHMQANTQGIVGSHWGNGVGFQLAGEPQSLQPAELKPVTVSINSIDELMLFFESLNYTAENFHGGNKSVPRLTFDAVGKGWRSVSEQLPVKQKKMVFFRLMTPLVLLANEKVLQERQQVISAPLNDTGLVALAIKYKVISNPILSLSPSHRQALLERVDILPPSLVLAQAAKESGWGTSRFTLEGNALFGQWDFNGNGMEPKQKRQGMGQYGLARFETPLASVEGYLLNLNTHSAYHKMRQLRAESRQANQTITGVALAGTLDRYSERGYAYVEMIQKMIRTNKLYLADEAYLDDDMPLHLLTRTH
ncbi:glucosaminidase domain-containing protein [Shewanella xiamenensis]|uniref:glucosaminidase domain-containing protein n=1 Tax=Shewanella xiamenensis TaxID=332186 RepID=UPI001E3BCF68|nr:glucosaminidase domain-containing protein [Shewanella xiamenensis]MCL1071776.1 glucosaminidase domain-containing protein [Shewanella xiamenensis]MCR4535723.1 glucosaminidase domain-containing protein [Shewanella xiamenensis]WHF56547.1 glucosaminidase domain-containing protein [Shewanella xiamenensis]